MEYYAHTREQDGALQTVRAHLEGTGALARAFAEPFGAGAQAEYAGRMHDVGKCSGAFQDRLLRGGPRVDHATAGALEAWAAGLPEAAFAIAGHHGGLPDGGSPGDTPEAPSLVGRLKRRVGRELEDYSAWRAQVAPPRAVSGAQGSSLAQALYVRMLYSCLVDADYLDTEAFMSADRVQRGAGESIEVLARRFDQWVHDRGWDAPSEPGSRALGALRRQILRACRSAGERPRGLFTLTVPTGGGKTVSSLGFALSHALAHGLERVIYVVPYTSIIEQTAEIFRDILGEDNVLEHHSQAEWDPKEGVPSPQKQRLRLRLAMENWDAPVVVTTAVQFFESLYANKPLRCRKLHRIARSVLLFDEAQMLPAPYLRPCTWAIAQLVRGYGASAVLCTATQPALDGLLGEFAPEHPLRELAPDPPALYEAFRRTVLEMHGRLTDAELAARLNGHAQALCILNSRAQAQAVYAMLAGEGNYHLSTLLYPAHRQALLSRIRKRLKEGLPCRVVATSLIEAGVDVDFPVVYRALAGLDSILQAAGRCNREGKRRAEESRVHVFESERPAPRLFQQNIDATRGTMRRFEDPASLEAVADYFRFYRELRGDRALDMQDILPALARGCEAGHFPFAWVAARFRLIEGNTKIVYVLSREEDARSLERRLRAGERSRVLLRALGRFSVSVYPDHFEALAAAGALERLDEAITLLSRPELYDESLGLSMQPEGDLDPLFF